MTKFLESLKDSLDKGEFNSDIAKKLTEINELADRKLKGGMTTNDLEESLISKAQMGGIKTVSEEEAAEINQDFEKKMADIKKVDGLNKELALLIEIEDAVKATIEDMFYHIGDVVKKYEKELEDKDILLTDLSTKIEELKSKYKSIIN